MKLDRRRLTRKLTVAGAGIALAAVATTASATGIQTGGGGPVAQSVLGSGDGSTQAIMNTLDSLYLFSPGCAQIPTPSGPTAWKDFSCQFPDPPAPPSVPTVLTENYQHDQVHEADALTSDLGISQLCNQGQPGVAHIDYARSARGPQPGDCAGLHFVSYATNGSSPVYNVYCSASCPGGASSQPAVNYVGENGWLCKPSTAHGLNPVTGRNYRTDIAAAISGAGLTPYALGNLGGGLSDTTQSFCRLANTLDVTAQAGDGQVLLTWNPFSGTPAPTNYTVTTATTGSGTVPSPTTTTATTVTVTGLTNYFSQTPTKAGYTFTVTPNFAAGGGGVATTGLVYPQAVAGQFNPLPPTRILDTRSATRTGTCTPAPCSTLTTGAETTNLQVAGVGGVPSTGVSAVVLNVTVVAAPSNPGSFLTLFPAGTTQPTAANLNFGPGQIVPNLVTVKLGTGGAGVGGNVSIFNAVSTTDIIADVAGWYTDGTPTPGVPIAVAASRYNPLTPARVLDTRNNPSATPPEPIGTCSLNPCKTLGALANPEIIKLQLTGQGGVPSTGVSAVVMNVTVVSPATNPGSFLTLYPSGSPLPTAANLNFGPSKVVPNLVTVKLGPDGAVNIFNAVGSVDVIADVAGWYATPGSITGSRFNALSPLRILDTRNAPSATPPEPIGSCTPSPCAAIGAAATTEFAVAGQGGAGGVPASGASAAVMNVTVVPPASNPGSFLTLFPSDASLPTAANLNFGPSQIVPNLVAVKLGADGGVKAFNAAGTVDVIADVAGWFNDGSS